MDTDGDALTIGRRVRQIRHARGKSLVVIAGIPFARDVVGVLARSRRDAVGWELRGMAYRAGLPCSLVLRRRKPRCR